MKQKKPSSSGKKTSKVSPANPISTPVLKPKSHIPQPASIAKPAPTKPTTPAPKVPVPAPVVKKVVVPAPAAKVEASSTKPVAPAPQPAPALKPAPSKPTAPVPASKAPVSAPIAKKAVPSPTPKVETPDPKAAPTAAPKPVAAAPTPKAPAPVAPVAAPKEVKPTQKRVESSKPKASAKIPASSTPAVKETPAFQVPPILLEGDRPTSPASGSGPGKRFALGLTAPVEKFEAEEGELPDSYGTEQLFLTARDPHWLFAAWDLTQEQLRHYNALSVDHHLVLRVYARDFSGELALQVHVHPESRNWFIPVPHAGARYAAELGYYLASKAWVEISRSGVTLTPPDTLAEETNVRLTSLPADVPFEELLALVKSAVKEHVPLVEALQQLRAEGYANLPGPKEAVAPAPWTPAQEQALAQVVSIDQVRRVWIGSLEVTELIRRQLEKQASSLTAAQFSRPTSPGAGFSSLSSPFGGGGGAPGKEKGFWFNVNAELIIYGATEPDASVTIGGRPIRLRPDGSFSFRFALPDGEFSLPAVAVCADGDDARAALLEFTRQTEYRGDVGQHPQDESLQPPTPDAVS